MIKNNILFWSIFILTIPLNMVKGQQRTILADTLFVKKGAVYHSDVSLLLNHCFPNQCDFYSFVETDLDDIKKMIKNELEFNIRKHSIAIIGKTQLYCIKGDTSYSELVEFHFDDEKHVKAFEEKMIKYMPDGCPQKNDFPANFAWFIFEKKVILWIYYNNDYVVFNQFLNCAPPLLPFRSYGPK